MNKFKKILIMLAFILFLILLNTNVYAGSQKWNSLDYNVVLNEDGSADITETWNVYISGTNTMFKQFDLSDRNADYLISAPKVAEVVNGVEYPLEQVYEQQYHVDPKCFYGLMIDSKTYEIAWNVGLDDSSDTRTYKISYKVYNAVTVYNDCSEFYWQFLSKENTMTGKNITGTIHLPSGISNIEKLHVWGHGDYNGNTERTSTSQVNFDLDKIYSNSMLEIRVVTEDDIFTLSSNWKSKAKLSSILAEEQQWADEANAEKARNRIIVPILATAYIIVFVWFLTRIVKYLQQSKEIKMQQYPKNEIQYFRDIPNEKEATPARASYMYYFNTNSSTFSNFTSAIFSATILQLTLKKYISVEPIDKKNVRINILPKNVDKPLTEDERLIYDFIVSLAGSEGDFVETEILEKYAKKHYDEFHDLMQDVCKAAEFYQEDRNVIDKIRLKASKKWTSKGATYMLGAIFLFMLVILMPITIEMIICSIICLMNASKINALTPKAYEECNQWKGLKKYMEEFSLLKDREVPDLILWEKYLVYATTFGISKKVLEQLVKVYPQMTSEDYYRNGNYTYLYIASRDSGFDGLDSLNKSFSGIAKSASSAYSAAHSSGSGGGGGFSGGGGGRRRWRKLRWQIIKIKETKMFGELILLVILIGLNAFFAATEIAFISLNDAKIDLEAKEGNKKAKTIKAMLENPSKFLATIQIGITLAGFLSSAFASEAFASEIAPVLFKLVPSINLKTWNNIAIIIITMILSYFTLVFGELVPKRIAMKYSEKLAYASIGVIKAISVLTAPFVKLLTVSTNVISKIMGVKGDEEETVTEEEIRMMVDVGEEKGTIDKEEKEMINNIFEFDDKAVSEIMIPRKDVFALDMNLSISKVIEELSEDFRYSRVPVYDETIDNIKGIVYVKDILISTKNKSAKIKNIVKEAYFVPETKLVNELFEELRKNRKQIAIVLDEYGGTSGIVTMEDILEEIVGEIYDEYDEVENKYEKIDENTYLMSGGMPIYEVEKILDVEIPEGDYDTLSGYLVELLGRIPDEKEKPVVETEEVIYKIAKVADKRIVKVKVCKVEKGE